MKDINTEREINLMKPRYKVIADWPGADYLPGDIFTMEPDEDGTMLDKIHFVFEHTCKKFPHLFKPLSWWEERKPGEMPEYVKNNKVVIKILIGRDISESCSAWMFEKSPDGLRHRLELSYYQPATQNEYLNYLNKKP